MSNKTDKNKLFGKYNELALLLIGAFLTTLVGSYLTYFFQYTNWKHQYEADLIQAERKAATEFFNQVSSLMDKRLYRTKQVLWKVKSKRGGKEIEKQMNYYREVVFEWNDNLNGNLVLTQRYFGASVKHDLEQIYSMFSPLGSALETISLPRQIIQDSQYLTKALDEAEKKIVEIDKQVYRLNAKMMGLIKDGRIGVFSSDTDEAQSILSESIHDILDDKEATLDQGTQALLLSFLESYIDAYNQKNIEFLSLSLSEKAQIVVGHKNKDQQMEYEKVSVSDYLNGLNSVFQNNDFIDIQYDSVELFRYAQASKLYEITFKQRWHSARYKDEGFVSLIVDFSDGNKPVILVRAWQYGTKPSID